MADRTYDNEVYDNHGEIELGGAGNAYTARTARAIAGYFKGLRICGKANHTNSGAATLNVNEFGAFPIRKGATTALTGGEILSGKYYDFIYDATNNVFQLDGTLATLVESADVLADDQFVVGSGGARGVETVTAAQARDLIGMIVRGVTEGSVSSAAALDIAIGTEDMYEIELLLFAPATDNVDPFIRMSQSGSFLSGANDYSWSYLDTSGPISDGNDNQIWLNDGSVGNSPGETTSIWMRLYGPSTGVRKPVIWSGGRWSAAAVLNAFTGMAEFKANTNPIDGVRFQFSSGNIASGFYVVRSYRFT